MEKKRRYSSIILVLAAIIIFLGFSLFKVIQQNQDIKQALPYLYYGETIDYFNVIGVSNGAPEQNSLQDGKPCLLFIFSRPCTTCDKNLHLWRKMAGILKEEAAIYGIVLGNVTEGYNFAEQARLNFPIFVPNDLEKFIQNFRIKLNLSQTIVCKDKRVIHLKMGDIDGEESTNIIGLVRNRR